MLYEPSIRAPGPAPLLVLLHGCNQGAEDFAAGTRMNEAAEEAGVVVLYPEQAVAANALRCWNWYALQDRSNKDGDAALIASMTRQVVREHDIDATRVYVAGMSAVVAWRPSSHATIRICTLRWASIRAFPPAWLTMCSRPCA